MDDKNKIGIANISGFKMIDNKTGEVVLECNCTHDYEYSNELVGIFSQKAKCKKCGKTIVEVD